MDHQLRERLRRGWCVIAMLPTGEGLRVALGRVEAMEIHLVRIESGDAVLFQQIAGDAVGRVLQAWASLDDAGGDGLERDLVGGIGQGTCFVRFHGLDP
ncbi:hypothetical protein D3C80_1654020 [compost metagenome]